MMRKWHLELLLLSFLLAIVWLVFFFLGEQGGIVARIISDEAFHGNVTRLDLEQSGASYWEGFYGNLTGSNSDPVILSVSGLSLSVHKQNLGLIKCYRTEIYAVLRTYSKNLLLFYSYPNPGYINSLVAASPESLDEIMKYSELPDPIRQRVSGSAVFNETRVFNVGNRNITAPGRTLNSKKGKYEIGLLKDSKGNIVFVFTVSKNGTAFNGEAADYQMMLPAPISNNKVYYLFQDITDECDFPRKRRVPPSIPTFGEDISGNISICGNMFCEPAEDCESCPSDCGECPVETGLLPIFGLEKEENFITEEDLRRILELLSSPIITNPQWFEWEQILAKLPYIGRYFSSGMLDALSLIEAYSKINISKPYKEAPKQALITPKIKTLLIVLILFVFMFFGYVYWYKRKNLKKLN